MRVRLINYILKLQQSKNAREKARIKNRVDEMLTQMSRSQRLTYEECKEIRKKIEKMSRGD